MRITYNSCFKCDCEQKTRKITKFYADCLEYIKFARC